MTRSFWIIGSWECHLQSQSSLASGNHFLAVPFQGPWAPRKIANPDYFEDTEPLKNIGKIGGAAIEIWTMDNNYYFSNILATDDLEHAEEYREKFWKQKQQLEVWAPSRRQSGHCF